MENFLQVVLLGIIEGITEFLPISSTGHLLIAQHWLGRRSELFTVAIQAGAILAVVVIYWRRLWGMGMHFSRPENRDYLYKLFVAFLITVVGGLIAKLMGLELPETVAPVAWALIIGGFASPGTWPSGSASDRSSPQCSRARRGPRQPSSRRCSPA